MTRPARRGSAVFLLTAGACLMASVCGPPVQARQQAAGLVTRHDAAVRTAAPRPALLATTRVDLGPYLLAVDEHDGHIFVGNFEGSSVSMLAAMTGRLLRTTFLGCTPAMLATDQRTARVFVACVGGATPGTGSVSMLDASTGRLLTTTGALTISHPSSKLLAVNERAGDVYVVDGSDIAVLDATTGHLRRRVLVPVGQAGERVTVSEIVVDARQNRAYLLVAGVEYDHYIAVLDTVTTRLLLTVPFRSEVVEDFAVATRTERILYVEPSLHNTTLLARDARTGEERYGVGLNGYGSVGPVLVDEPHRRVYVDATAFGPRDTTETASLGVIAAATGDPITSTTLGLDYLAASNAPSGMSLADGTAIIALDGTNNRVYRLTAPIGDSSGPSSTARGRLLTLDATTLRVVGRVPVGRNPQAVAVDAPRHRVFVTNYGDDTVSVFDTTRL